MNSCANSPGRRQEAGTRLSYTEVHHDGAQCDDPTGEPVSAGGQLPGQSRVAMSEVQICGIPKLSAGRWPRRRRKTLTRSRRRGAASHRGAALLRSGDHHDSDGVRQAERNRTMYDIDNVEQQRKRGTMTTQLCPRCRFHPASPRIWGYCSWDCYEADDETPGRGGRDDEPTSRRARDPRAALSARSADLVGEAEPGQLGRLRHHVAPAVPEDAGLVDLPSATRPAVIRMASHPGAGRARTYGDICSVGTQPVEPIMSVAGGMASARKSSDRASGVAPVGEPRPAAQLGRSSRGAGATRRRAASRGRAGGRARP